MTVIGQMTQKTRFVLRVEARREFMLMRGCEEEAQNRQRMTRADGTQGWRCDEGHNSVPTYDLIDGMTASVSTRDDCKAESRSAWQQRCDVNNRIYSDTSVTDCKRLKGCFQVRIHGC